MENFDVRARITELLKETGMSNAELARQIGCDRRTVAYWRAHQRAFNADMLPAICESLSITPNQFFRTPVNPHGLLKKLKKLNQSLLEERLESLRQEQFIVQLALQAKTGGILLEEALDTPKES